jgi:hypothetical protein
MGRPIKLTDELEQTICNAIVDGATYAAASEAAGIAYSTFNEWMKDERPRFLKFSEAVRQANARARTELIRQIKQHGRKDWRALAWILERRFKDEYGNSMDLTSNGKELTLKIIPASQDTNADDSGE